MILQTMNAHEKYRRAAGLTVSALAHRAGYSHSYASRVEHGWIPASARYRRAFAQICHVPIASVFDPVTARVLSETSKARS